MALVSAPNLLFTSCNSFSGLLAATTPAPAWYTNVFCLLKKVADHNGMITTAIKTHKTNAAAVVAACRWFKIIYQLHRFYFWRPGSTCRPGMFLPATQKDLLPGRTVPVTSLTRCIT